MSIKIHGRNVVVGGELPSRPVINTKAFHLAWRRLQQRKPEKYGQLWKWPSTSL